MQRKSKEGETQRDGETGRGKRRKTQRDRETQRQNEMERDTKAGERDTRQSPKGRQDKCKETDWADGGGSYPGRPPGVAEDGVQP